MNLLWDFLIEKLARPNLDAFRCVLAFQPKLYHYNCQTQTTQTIQSVSREFSALSYLSCMEARMRQTGAKEYRDSEPMQLARRCAEEDALAKSNVRRMRAASETEAQLLGAVKLMRASVIGQINARVAVDASLFNICDEYDWQRGEASLVWEALKAKLVSVLDAATVSDRTVDWKFAHGLVVAKDTCLTRVVLNVDRAGELRKICGKALEGKRHELAKAMAKAVASAADAAAFEQLTQAPALRSTPSEERPKWRQDERNPPHISEEMLDAITLHTTSPEFDAKLEYDFNYLTERLTDAHTIDPHFRRGMSALCAAHDDLSCAALAFGPVKRAERCRAKAMEADDYEKKHPKTATVIDLVRCSLTYRSVSEMASGALKLMDVSKEGVADEKESEEGAFDLSFVRIKNGFEVWARKNPEQLVPTEYCDVKINVWMRAIVDGEWRNVIGEIQFLVQPMLAS